MYWNCRAKWNGINEPLALAEMNLSKERCCLLSEAKTSSYAGLNENQQNIIQYLRNLTNKQTHTLFWNCNNYRCTKGHKFLRYLPSTSHVFESYVLYVVTYKVKQPIKTNDTCIRYYLRRPSYYNWLAYIMKLITCSNTFRSYTRKVKQLCACVCVCARALCTVALYALCRLKPSRLEQVGDHSHGWHVVRSLI